MFIVFFLREGCERGCQRMAEQKRPGRWRVKLLIAGMILLVLLLCAGCVALTLFLQDSRMVTGRSGFVQQAVWRGTLVLIVASLAVMLLFRLRDPEQSGLTVGLCTVLILLCLAGCYFLVRPVVLDLPYLEQPAVTYLNALGFDVDDFSDAPTEYEISGTGLDGKDYTFSIGINLYNSGRTIWEENHSLHAKVAYLPHTDVVMSLEYLPALDEVARALYPSSPDLPENWDSLAIQINDSVYTLPQPLSDFLDDGWTFADPADAERTLAGASEPYSDYDHISLDLVNQAEQEIDVTVYNTSEQDLPISECTVGGLYIIYGNYDFSGQQVQLPGGMMLGWSNREDVLRQYGTPSDAFEDYSLDYNVSPAHRLNLTFTDDGILDSIMIHAQEYFRSD